MAASLSRSLIIDDTSSALRLIIPSKKNAFLIAFLALWFLAWTGGGISLIVAVGSELIVSLSTGQGSQFTGFSIALLLLWLVLWMGGVLYSLYTLLWQLTGREVAEVTGGAITISRQVLGRGRARVYSSGGVHRLRTARLPSVDWFTWRLLGPLWRIPGRLAFDEGGHTILFGADLTSAEARLALAAVLERYPEYREPGLFQS